MSYRSICLFLAAVAVTTVPSCICAADTEGSVEPPLSHLLSTGRQVSAHLSEAIIEGLPRYDAAQRNNPATDASDDALRLPKFHVFDTKLPNFTARELLSKSEYAKLLRKKYPGASVAGQDPYRIDGYVPNYAALMHADDKRLADMKNLADFSDILLRSGEIAGSNEMRAEIQRTFWRKHDFLIESMDRSANNDRR